MKKTEKAPKLRPELQHLAVPLDSLHHFEGNPRQGDIGAISESLRHHSQFRPVVVRKQDNTILCGNHLVAAARALGWTEVAATFVDVPDDADAARILLIDNRTSDLSSQNATALSELLQSLPGLEGTGYDGDALDELLSDLTTPASLEGADPLDREPTSSGPSVTIMFPSEVARADWRDFCAALGQRFPDLETLGERLHAFVTSPEIVAFLHREERW